MLYCNEILINYKKNIASAIITKVYALQNSYCKFAKIFAIHVTSQLKLQTLNTINSLQFFFFVALIQQIEKKLTHCKICNVSAKFIAIFQHSISKLFVLEVQLLMVLEVQKPLFAFSNTSKLFVMPSFFLTMLIFIMQLSYSNTLKKNDV